MDPNVLRCRARRMVNPFRGVMQTIEAEQVDAVSIDGLRWGLYITDESVYDFVDLNSVAPFHSTNVKYGEWSEKDGLLRSPSLPTMNYERIRERGEELLRIVKAQSKHVPFALTDRFERWLLDDKDRQPVVLLETGYSADEARYNSNTLWRIGQHAQREFLDRNTVDPETSAALRIQQLVNQRCRQGLTVWVERDEMGQGLVLERPGDDPGEPMVLAAGAFPPYGIRQAWRDGELAGLVEGYLHWLSPCLLTIVGDSAREIEKLVEHAVQYPERLYQVRRLLPPDLLACKEIKSALVQAELSRAG